jgi:PAS domain S-box-containing protein
MERRINIAIVLCLVALTLGCLIAVRTVQRQQSEQSWIDHTHKVRQMVRDIQYTVTVAESVRRAFLLSDEDKFAQGVFQMEGEYRKGLEALRAFILDNGPQQTKINNLAKLMDERFGILKESVALHRTNPDYSKEQKDFTDRGFALSESIRHLIIEIDGIEQGLLADRQRAYVSTNISATRGVAVLGIFGILIATVIFNALRKEVIQRRAAEASSNQQAMTLSSILDNMREGVMVYDQNGIITRVNPAASRIIAAPLEGTSPKERTSRGSIRKDDAVTPMSADEMPSARALRGETVDHETVCIKNETHPDGLWLALSATPTVGENGKPMGATVVFRDVTDLMRQQEEINRLNSQLQRSVVRLETSNKELEAFSYTVSHDLRGPLRAIYGFTQALAEDYSDKLDETGLNYLSRVSAASQRMTQLIEGLLSLTQITPSSLIRKPDDISAFAQLLVSEIALRAPERHVQFDIEPGMEVFADPALVHIAVENLLENAWKFTATREEGRIAFGSEMNGDGEPVFFVRDNGVGFDVMNSGKLFGVFQRLHSAEEFPGMGIGLATVQRIIHVHGGRVWADSKPGEGATFFFTLGEPQTEHKPLESAAA